MQEVKEPNHLQRLHTYSLHDLICSLGSTIKLRDGLLFSIPAVAVG